MGCYRKAHKRDKGAQVACGEVCGEAKGIGKFCSMPKTARLHGVIRA